MVYTQNATQKVLSFFSVNKLGLKIGGVDCWIIENYVFFPLYIIYVGKWILSINWILLTYHARIVKHSIVNSDVSDEGKHIVVSHCVRQCCRARRSEVFNYFPFSIQFVEINEMKRKYRENCYSKQWPLADMALVGRSRRSPAIIEVSSFHHTVNWGT